MNQTKRTALVYNIRRAFAQSKREPPRLTDVSGKKLRQLGRALGILRGHVAITPLSFAERETVWAKARQDAAIKGGDQEGRR